MDCKIITKKKSEKLNVNAVVETQVIIAEVYFAAEDIEDRAVLKKLKDALTKMNNNRLQLELNALLMVGPPMDNPDWRLARFSYKPELRETGIFQFFREIC